MSHVKTEVIRELVAWNKIRDGELYKDKSVGFVPTMGALHEGHLELVRRSLKENDRTVVSIFVNPTQFNDKADLATYPSTLEEDVRMLNELGVDHCIFPEYSEVYRDSYRFRVTENEVSKVLCGAHRPGHFDGVLTVVLKLFQMARPHRAYFGEKDYQQYLLIKDMANAFFMNLEIVPCATVREADGLALSSRNRKLSDVAREKAPRFHKILAQSISVSEIKTELSAEGFDVDYVEEHFGRRFGAVFLDGVRLIDNVKV